MSLYKPLLNPFTGELNLVADQALLKIKESVATYNNLPTSGNVENDTRIVQDTDKMYTWSVASSSGNLTDWKEIGSASSVDWSAITNKPSSSTADIDDAVSKKHSQNTDTKLDEGGANEVTAAEVKNVVDNALVASVDDFTIKNDSGTLKIADRIEANILNNSFNRAIDQSETVYNLVDGFVDDFQDQSGIDTAASTNEIYDSVNDLYETVDQFPDTVVFLSHFDGNDEATSTTDESQSNHSITFIGNAQLDTAQKKLGTASLYLDGSGDKLEVDYSDDFDFGAGEFTVDAFLRTDGAIPNDARYIIASQYQVTSNKRGWYFAIATDGSGVVYLRFVYSQNGSSSTSIIKQVSWTTGTWYHVAVERDGNDLNFYFEGTKVNTQDVTGSTIFNPEVKFNVGGFIDSSSEYFKGWIDELRIIKGDGIYGGSNFTPPTSQYTSSVDEMTLISNGFTAQVEPDTIRFVLAQEDVDVITLNTDLKIWGSRDGGTTWSQGTLSDIGNLQGSENTLDAIVDVSGQPSGTTVKYKIEALNNKEQKIKRVGANWG